MTTRRPSKSLRRGFGIAAVVILLAAINLAVIGSVSASANEAQSGALRAETVRAFYAGESAGRVVIKCSIQGLPMPAVSSTLILGPATATYIAVPAAGQAGTVDIKAVDGTTTRRVRLTLSSS